MTGTLRLAALATALTLGACAPNAAPPIPPAAETDPVLQSHSQWCNANPPSGYCDVDDHR